MDNKTMMLDPKKGWIPAIQEPYYSSILERIKHFFGFHCWTSNVPPCGSGPRMCLICHKKEE